MSVLAEGRFAECSAIALRDNVFAQIGRHTTVCSHSEGACLALDRRLAAESVSFFGLVHPFVQYILFCIERL